MFVLGYRAKKLRQGRLSELIHNSEGLLNLESCTVEVHFKLIDDDNSIEERIYVSRTAYRNNSNKYHINGNVSNYVEVTTLLKNFGVDLDHKRFLILQVKKNGYFYMIFLMLFIFNREKLNRSLK